MAKMYKYQYKIAFAILGSNDGELLRFSRLLFKNTHCYAIISLEKHIDFQIT